jgi:hypothetical protein
MSFHDLGKVAPIALTQARVELHWLAQVLAATGDAFLEPAADDSQSNAVWNPTNAALVGRPIGNGAQLGLVIAKAELVVIGADGAVTARIAARGKKLAELLLWAGDAMAVASNSSAKAALKVRDYAMPEHAVSKGQAFAFEDAGACAELARWFENATVWITEARDLDSRASEVRCWPHHFDIGGIIMLEPDKPFEEARQMGFGWSPGDASYDEPYFYITPFPVPENLFELPSGHWHSEGFTAAILTGTDVANSDAQTELVTAFLRDTIAKALPLITE